jgi:branched-chain amino acid transport system permease protein
MEFFNQGQTIAMGRVFWFTGKVAARSTTSSGTMSSWSWSSFGIHGAQPPAHPLWRCLSAVRDNDRAADAMGMHPGLTKVYAFALAGFFAGMAGALHAYLYRGVGFESFTLHHSITYLAMAIVGWSGHTQRFFLGTGDRHHSARTPGGNPFRTRQPDIARTWNLATALKPFSFGLVIVLFLMFEPRGIANWWRIVRSYTKLWPFRY